MKPAKLLKYAKVKPIHVLVYRMDPNSVSSLEPTEFEVVKSQLPDGKTRFSLTDNGIFVHNSFVFPKIRLLKLLRKNGPAIGDCVTSADYRGRAIYPKVINGIARELLSKGEKEVFIVVNHDNVSSIRGIEKAGFEWFAEIRAKRWLFFYFSVRVKRP